MKIIGIDPGVHTGVAIYCQAADKIEFTKTCGILEAMEIVKGVKELKELRIENPHLRKWFGLNSNAKKQGAGSVKRDYKIWVEFCTANGIAYVEVHPKAVPIITKSMALALGCGRTSVHARDAIGLALKRFV